MAARAQSVRAPVRRRPARRKPAARRGATRVKWDRLGRIALTLVLAAVLYSYLNPAIDFVKTYTATTATKEKLHTLLRENKHLHHNIQSAKNPIVVDRKARALGMVSEGETPIVIRGLN